MQGVPGQDGARVGCGGGCRVGGTHLFQRAAFRR